MRIYLITLFLIIADFQIKYYYAMGLEINKVETRTNQPDLNGTFDGHKEPMDPDFPGLEDLAIISELDGASRLEPNSLELRQSQGCNDIGSDCPLWTSLGYCTQSFVQFMANNCKKSCNLCGNSCNDNYPASSQCPSWASWACNSAQYANWMATNCQKSCNQCGGGGSGSSSNGNNVCEFESGVVYAQEPLSNPMSRQQCKQECNSRSACQFWTWNENTRKCGIRDYETDGKIVYAPSQWTGRKGSIYENPNSDTKDYVYVSRSAFVFTSVECKNFCQNDNKCTAVTFSGNSCALTYASKSSLRRISEGIPASVSSAEKVCN